MIITTTPSVEGRAIREYKGIVFGEVISGVNFMKDLGAVFGISLAAEVPVMRKSFRRPGKRHWKNWNSGQEQWAPMQ